MYRQPYLAIQRQRHIHCGTAISIVFRRLRPARVFRPPLKIPENAIAYVLYIICCLARPQMGATSQQGWLPVNVSNFKYYLCFAMQHYHPRRHFFQHINLPHFSSLVGSGSAGPGPARAILPACSAMRNHVRTGTYIYTDKG